MTRLVVHGCFVNGIACPFFERDSDLTVCHHPVADRKGMQGGHFRVNVMPDWCPLREQSVEVMAVEAAAPNDSDDPNPSASRLLLRRRK